MTSARPRATVGTDMAIGLALSGGGFRATLFHLGVVRALRDAGLLKDVTRICSVSGGSILAAHLVLHWEDYLGAGFEARSREILDFAAWDVRNRIVRRYPNLLLRWLAAKIVPFDLVQARGATDLLIDAYRRLYGDATVEQLRGAPGRPRPTVHLLTTNVTTGTLCSFGGDGFHSEAAEATGRTAQAAVSIPAATPSLCFAVAASSAFPGMFSPLRLTAEELGKYDAPLQPEEQFITDGGVYDNLGVRKFMNSPEDLRALDRVFVSNASLELKTRGGREHVGMMKTALRAADLLSHRVHELESSAMARVSAEAPAGKFVPIHLRDVVPRSEEPEALHENTQEWLRWMRTDLDRFSPFEVHCLVRQGWTLARRAIRSTGAGAPTSPAWDPVPASHIPANPVRQVRVISKSVARRWRPFGLRDPITWIHAAVLLLVLGASFPAYLEWQDMRRPHQIESLRSRVRSQAAAQQHRLSVELAYRRTPDGKGFAREHGREAPKVASPYVTLTTLNSLLSDNAQLVLRATSAHLSVLDETFNPAGSFNAEKVAWPGAKDPQALRAEPTFWALSVVSRLLQTPDLGEDQRKSLRAEFTRLRAAVDQFSLGNGGWKLILEEREPVAHPYVAAVAIEAFLEHRKAWKQDEFLKYDLSPAAETCRRLARDWTPPAAPGGFGGWAVSEENAKPAVSPGLTMMVYTALLRAEEADPGLSVFTPAMLEDLARRVERLGREDEADFIEARTIALLDAPEKGPRASAKVRFYYQWLPWAIECSHEWVQRLGRAPHPDRDAQRRILTALQTLDRLTGAPLAAALARADNHITENLSEFHLALGRILAR